MTKKELYTAVMAVAETHNLKAAVVADLKELLEPKKAGMQIDIESIVERDAEGNVVNIQCGLSGVWLPATLEYFYEDKNSKIVNAEGIGLYKNSRLATAAKREADRVYKASKEAIVADLLDGVISQEEAKEQIATLPTEPDYSTVVA